MSSQHTVTTQGSRLAEQHKKMPQALSSRPSQTKISNDAMRPCPVTMYQMLALYEMRDIVGTKGELEYARQEQRVDTLMQPVENLIATCNHKLRSLGLVIHRNSDYLLTQEKQ